MANQFASEAAELFKALTGIETLSGAAVASYLVASVLTFLHAKTPALQSYVDARPRLAKFVVFLRVFAAAWSEAQGATNDKK
jgi:hypothetical protein